MEEQKLSLSLSDLDGLFTAYQAFIRLEAIVCLHDANARLVSLRSNEDITHEGDSDEWFFIFLLPTLQAECFCQLYRDRLDVSGAPSLTLDMQVLPYAVPQALLEQYEQTRDELWQHKLDSHPALPVPFYDSPKAIIALTEEGADFITGSTSMLLSAEVLPSSEVVWKVFCFGQEYKTPFNRM